MDDYIALGRISGFFGVKGWVKLYSYSRPRVGIAQYRSFFCGEKRTPIVFTQIKESGKHIVAHIADVDSREAATSYLGQSLFVKQSDLPKLENEYYWHELIGLRVIDQENRILGKIAEMMETGANDVMVIKNESDEETLIPYAIPRFVLSVDIPNGEMQVNWALENNE